MECLETLSLAHYGIVAAFVDKLGLVEFLDRHLPKTGLHYVSSGQAAKAVILNGLGFVERRLYLFHEFFEDLPTERLIGPGVRPEHLNDDVIGRLLDNLSDANISLLYERFVVECLAPFLPKSLVLHGDTTNISVHGEYLPDEGFTWQITFGHAKDGRTDLKRFVISMVASGEGVPLFLELLSGNESDKKSIVRGLEATSKTLEILGESPLFSVADAAFYTKENIRRLQGAWISRVPATIAEAAELLETESPLIPAEDPRYSYLEKESTYGDIPQRWILFRSEEMAAKQEKTLTKRLEKTLSEAEKAAAKLGKTGFFCEEDARKAAEEFFADHPLVEGEVLLQQSRTRRSGKRGRPAAGEEMEIRYFPHITPALRQDAIERLRNKLGRFILATTATGPEAPSAEEILALYKEQGAVERGFRFIKDSSFHASEIYLKKEERIEGLMFLMTIALVIYNLAEKELREKLAASGESIPDPKGKPMKTPTLKRLFHLFFRVSIIVSQEEEKRTLRVMNLNDTHRRVLALFGKDFERYYESV